MFCFLLWKGYPSHAPFHVKNWKQTLIVFSKQGRHLSTNTTTSLTPKFWWILLRLGQKFACHSTEFMILHCFMIFRQKIKTGEDWSKSSTLIIIQKVYVSNKLHLLYGLDKRLILSEICVVKHSLLFITKDKWR